MPGVPFQKGADPRRNPGGRTRSKTTGIAALAREVCKDGRELVEFFRDVYKGTLTCRQLVMHNGEPSIQDVPPNLTQRMEAGRWLKETGWGRAWRQKEEEPETEDTQLSDEAIISHLQSLPPPSKG